MVIEKNNRNLNIEESLNYLTLKTPGQRDYSESFPQFSTQPPTNLKKENTMSKINADILIQLAQADTQDEFTQNLVSMPVQLREALEEQRKQESKEAYAKAAKLILCIYKDSEKSIAEEVQVIRNARAKEQAAKDKIAKIKLAKAYAEATNNYLPLAYLSGHMQFNNGIDSSKLMVPTDWVPPVEKAEVPAAVKK